MKISSSSTVFLLTVFAPTQAVFTPTTTTTLTPTGVTVSSVTTITTSFPVASSPTTLLPSCPAFTATGPLSNPPNSCCSGSLYPLTLVKAVIYTPLTVRISYYSKTKSRETTIRGIPVTSYRDTVEETRCAGSVFVASGSGNGAAGRSWDGQGGKRILVGMGVLSVVVGGLGVML